MTLRAHPNVISLAEERQRRRVAELAEDDAVRFVFVGWRPEPSHPSHPAAQALLAGLMQGIGERENDVAMVDAGRRLEEPALNGQPVASGWRWRAKRLVALLGFGKRLWPS